MFNQREYFQISPLAQKECPLSTKLVYCLWQNLTFDARSVNVYFTWKQVMVRAMKYFFMRGYGDKSKKEEGLTYIYIIRNHAFSQIDKIFGSFSAHCKVFLLMYFFLFIPRRKFKLLASSSFTSLNTVLLVSLEKFSTK